jgi:N-carbamoyl-L-amino-acid hydrolase
VNVASTLEELDRRFPDRVAWSSPWQECCEWLVEEARAFGADLERDRAGNQWLTLRGERDLVVIIGGHLDTDPLSGLGVESVGVVAGLELLRRLAEDGPPPVTVKLVNWADGSGARFGRPFGASAAAGRMPDWFVAAELVDRYGTSLNEVAENAGLMLKLVPMARRLLSGTHAYIELGVDSAVGSPLAVATADAGIERCRIRWLGQPGGDARAAAELFEIEFPGVERLRFEPPDAIHLIDLRSLHADELEQQLDEALEASDRIALAAGITVEWKQIWAAPPVKFDPELTDLAARELAVERTPTLLQVGATELARADLPATLILLRDPNQIELAVDSLERILDVIVDLVASRSTTQPNHPGY